MFVRTGHLYNRNSYSPYEGERRICAFRKGPFSRRSVDLVLQDQVRAMANLRSVTSGFTIEFLYDASTCFLEIFILSRRLMQSPVTFSETWNPKIRDGLISTIRQLVTRAIGVARFADRTSVTGFAGAV